MCALFCAKLPGGLEEHWQVMDRVLLDMGQLSEEGKSLGWERMVNSWEMGHVIEPPLKVQSAGRLKSRLSVWVHQTGF